MTDRAAMLRDSGASPTVVDDDGDGYLVAVEGAPDVLLERSASFVCPDEQRPLDVAARAGIDVKMVTGDHPGTAAAIAREIGISGRVVPGRELDGMGDDELVAAIDDVGVLARVSPEHKVRIVDALHTRREVVAMTGDGVNDAAALRRADVGLAMGIAGTEVTKEAADIVLADDDFITIVDAVERGRTIYDNILTFVRFQLPPTSPRSPRSWPRA